jgi:hypothetical protein
MMRRLIFTFGTVVTLFGCGTLPQGTALAPLQRDAAILAAADARFEVSGQFRLNRRPLSIIRPTYDVLEGDRKVGVLQRKFFAATSSWRLMAGDDTDIGSMEQNVAMFGFKATVRSVRGTVVAEIKQDILRSLIRPGVVLQVLDPNKQLIFRSSPAWFTLQGRVDLLNPTNQKIGTMVPVWLRNGESRLVDLQQPVDRRLLLAFLAAQLDLAARRSQSAPAPSTRPSAQPPQPTPSSEPTPPPAPPVPSPPPPIP